MKRIALVASREFLTTVGTKGFVFGLLVMPVFIAMMIAIGPRIMNARSPQVRGDVAIVDPTGRVAEELRTSLDPATIEARRAEGARRMLSEAAPAFGQAAGSGEAMQRAVGQVPALRVVERPPDADPQRAKEWLVTHGPEESPLALVVVSPDAVVRRSGQAEFGSYDLYVSSSLDDATESVIYEALRQALVSSRLRASSLDQAAIEATMRVPRPRSVIVAAGGEQQAQRGFNRALPFILGVFLFVGVVIGGQTLMTSTIEEKSSRVVEVLLAAVSPFELMAGKLIGQLAVGLLIAPYILTPMIAQAPNSTFSVVVSLIPPVSSFAMMARLASGTPPPTWQVLLTMVIGMAAALGCVWFAAKIFKIGLLMHGKPPNLATLIRWARAA